MLYDRMGSPILQLCAGFVLLCIAQTTGYSLSSGTATLIGCVAILLVGLPHGAFDYHLIKMHSAGSQFRLLGLLTAYLLLAAMVYSLWQASPVAALLIFLAISVFHFAEDWSEDIQTAGDGNGFDLLSLAPAAAILCLPALSHPEQLAIVFEQLTGTTESLVAADLMMLFAPVAVLLALVKSAIDWAHGEYNASLNILITMLAMIIFPPVIGFAIYFCLAHSPKQFAKSKEQLVAVGLRNTAWLVWPVTMLAMLIALGIYFAQIRLTLEASAITSVFMTLSILTAPHMAMPLLIRRIEQRIGTTAYPSSSTSQ